jgi:dTDP-4-dehydrorhamnose 3,5-epimerase
MKVIETPLEGLFVIESRVFGDDRGFFTETFNQKAFAEHGLITDWKQDNWSRSQKGVLRGLHFQREPYAQAKLVRVMAGSAFDVAVDVRPNSKTRGQWFGIELNAENKRALYIPAGFAHGFLALADGTDFFYKCSALYAPEYEGGYMWNDPAFNIQWPLPAADLILSPKDQKFAPFNCAP